MAKRLRRLIMVALCGCFALPAQTLPTLAADVLVETSDAPPVVVRHRAIRPHVSRGPVSCAGSDYVRAAFRLRPLAENGNARAQTCLGFMYYYGRGVPQSYEEAARFYGNAALQGVPVAQFQFGLLFDKAQGVPQDYVLAFVWLNRAVAAAPPREREQWTNVRNAVSNKLTLAQKTLAQRLSIGTPVVNTSALALDSWQHLY